MSVDKSVEEIKSALAAVMPATVQNGDITTSSGGYGIDLLGAASLLRLSTPWTDRLPRMGVDATGLSAQWWEILTGTGRANNTTGTAAEGARGGQLGWSGALKTAKYKSVAIDAAVTDEQRKATSGILDPLAFNMNAALVECKRSHHMQNLFGRGETLLGTASTPSLSAVNSGGAVPAQTNSVIVVALNGGAMRRLSTYTINGSWTATASSGSELMDSTRTNGDGSTTTVAGGTSIKSAAATQATTGGASTLTASWVPTPGACGYALFVGVAGSEVFQGVTVNSSVTMTLLKTGSWAAASRFTADNSKDPLEYDGLITLLQASDSPAQQIVLPNNTALSSGSDFTIDQLEPAFAYFFQQFDGYSPEYALVSGATKRKIAKALLSNSNASRAVYMVAAGAAGNGEMTIGQGVLKILNPYTNDEIEVLVDPYMPDGKIILGTYKIPTQFGASVTNAVFFRPQQEFYGETWPRSTRKWSNGVSLIGALCAPWRAGHAVIDNVWG